LFYKQKYFLQKKEKTNKQQQQNYNKKTTTPRKHTYILNVSSNTHKSKHSPSTWICESWRNPLQ